MIDRFLGLWILDPTTCRYGSRPAPRRGVYELSGSEAAIAARVVWVDAVGESHQVQFDLVPDGAPRPLADGGDVVCRVEGDALVSEVLREGEVVSEARRELSADGGQLRVVQRSVGPRGVDETEAVYRRALADVKQVLLFRRDLNMRKGKIAAQVAHASMKVLLDRDEGSWQRLEIPLDEAMASWTRARFAKIVLSVEDEASLIRAYEEARVRGLPAALITDAGHTEFHGVPTRTAVAIGPARSDAIDAVTGPDGLIATKLA